MPPYTPRSTFLATGLEPYAAPRPSPPPTSGPLFTTQNPTPPDAATPPPTPLCPICLDPLDPRPPAIRIRACTHAYHAACLSRWLDRQNTCPACRAVLFGAPARRRDGDGMVGRAEMVDAMVLARMGRLGSRRRGGAVGRVRLDEDEDVDEDVVRAEMPPLGVGEVPPPPRRAGRREVGVSPWDVESTLGRRRGPRGSGREVSPEAEGSRRGGRRGRWRPSAVDVMFL